MNKKLTDILAYLGIIGLIIAYVATSDKKASKLALNQGLVLAIISIICTIAINVLYGIPVIGSIIVVVARIVNILILVFSIWGIVNAVKEEDKPLPFIGDIKIL